MRGRGLHWSVKAGVIKSIFSYRKVSYKGLAKNQAQLFSLFGFGNLMLARPC
jgi:transposase, IS5 family